MVDLISLLNSPRITFYLFFYSFSYILLVIILDPQIMNREMLINKKKHNCIKLKIFIETIGDHVMRHFNKLLFSQSIKIYVLMYFEHIIK